jgi:ATP-dependent DNA helicase RecG
VTTSKQRFLKTLGLNERQKKAVDYAKERGEINNTAYRKINNIGKVTAARELNELVTKGVLKAIGRGRAIRYVLNE